MNKMYADRNGKPIDSKENPALKQVRLLAERERAAREKSANIIDYYTNGKKKGIR